MKASEKEKKTEMIGFFAWVFKWVKEGLIGTKSGPARVVFFLSDSRERDLFWSECHSWSLDRPADHRRFPAGFTLLSLCVCLCVCAGVCGMVNEGRIPQSLQRRSRQSQVIIHWETEPDVDTVRYNTLAHTHTHRPCTQWDSVVIWLHCQMHMHTHCLFAQWDSPVI